MAIVLEPISAEVVDPPTNCCEKIDIEYDKVVVDKAAVVDEVVDLSEKKSWEGFARAQEAGKAKKSVDWCTKIWRKTKAETSSFS